MSAFTHQVYLSDLVNFTRMRVRFGSSNPAPTDNAGVSRRLASAFLQPFDRLLDDQNHATATRPVQQIRLAVEILRGYLGALSVDTAQADRRYRQAAYQALLASFGSSYEELRGARAAHGDTLDQARAALAERLGLDRAARLDQLFLAPDDISEERLEQLFGLAPTTGDPFAHTQHQPALLKWRADRLRMLWADQDLHAPASADGAPILDPDLIDEQLVLDPDQVDPEQFIDSDIVDAGARLSARGRWQARRQAIDAMIAEVRAKIQAATSAQPTPLAAYSQVLEAFLGNVDLDSALAARAEDAPDPNQERNQSLEPLTIAALRRLIRLRALAAAGALLDPEWADLTGILVQLKKQQRFADWRAEEQADGLSLSPDFFALPGAGAPAMLPRWRAARSARIAWLDTLRARVKQLSAVVQTLQSAADSTAGAALRALRDGLIAALSAHLSRPDTAQLADQLTRRLLIDFKRQDDHQTTRLAQASETLHELFFALRMGQGVNADLPGANPARDWALKTGPHFSEADFDTEWHWMGSYATRRAVEFVKNHPENYLLPSLRDTGDVNRPPTKAFWSLIDNLRARPQLTPGQARQLANQGLGDPAADSPVRGYLRNLRAELGDEALPDELSAPFAISEQLSPGALSQRRALIRQLFDAQDLPPTDQSGGRPDPHLAPAWLQEIFYFVPIAIALQLQRAGEYLAALDWYQTVYAYQLAPDQRTVYRGLELEDGFPDQPHWTPGLWLREELNPHYFARKRKSAYTRFTIESIAQCLLDYADSEFTLASEEALPRARALYFAALDLLNLPDMQTANPLLAALRQHARLSLEKLRSGRDIAGMERPAAEPPAAQPANGQADLPVIGSGGQLVVRSAGPVQPTPYRYATLIARAKQLVGIAQQMEASYLSALQRRDAEAYNLLRARQDLQISRATIQLQELRVGEADAKITLANLQQERAQIQSETFKDWIDAGLNQWEQTMIDSYQEAGEARTWAAYADMGLQVAQAATTAATASYNAAAAAAGAFAVSVAAQARFAATATAINAETTGQVASVYATQERRKQEWQLQHSLAEQDVTIAGQQIALANQQKSIADQERQIAGTRAEQADAAVDFLANKFTNADLYEWMSGVLGRVYSYFLQQATAMARLAQNQLAFERQESPPSFIQADYWQPPARQGAAADTSAADRRGLTGSARLLQDIYKLDQYAFETNTRKLQLSQTFSLARLFPFEFQRFRESGALPFATPMALFDRAFPGHYLRLIKRVRTSVVALIPPTQGIRATLAAAGVSRVVVGPDVFRTVAVHRRPELIAFTSPSNATGLFELSTDGDMLLPFEGMGVDTSWRLELPRAANGFDFRTIADVRVTIEYTALHSFDYRQQVIRQLDNRIGGERSFSFRREFADAWYDLHQADRANEPLAVRFRTRRADFPPNVDRLQIAQLLLYVARADGASDEVAIAQLDLTPAGASEALAGGAATTVDGLISTRRANGSSWIPLLGGAPAGTWELTFANSAALHEQLAGETIDDILFVISYAGETPPWP